MSSAKVERVDTAEKAWRGRFVAGPSFVPAIAIAAMTARAGGTESKPQSLFCGARQVQGHALISFPAGLRGDFGLICPGPGADAVIGCADDSFHEGTIADRARHVHLLIGVERQFFKNMAALSASEFEYDEDAVGMDLDV